LWDFPIGPLFHVLDHLDKYTDELDTLMAERFRLVPKKEENTVQA
jgi:hypothetical protein